MQDVSLPSSTVSGSAPHAQATSLWLGVFVFCAALPTCYSVFCTADAIAISIPIALEALLGTLSLLTIPPSRSCIYHIVESAGSDKE